MKREYQPDLKAYPLPVKDILTVEWTSTSASNRGDEIIVINQLGAVLWSKTDEGDHREEISVSQWPAGLYYVKVKSPNGQQQVHKILKE